MDRITDARIERLVKRLQDQGMDIELDSQYGRFAVTTKDGSRTLSSRLPNRQIYDWLFAFEMGWDAAMNHIREQMREATKGRFAAVMGDM